MQSKQDWRCSSCGKLLGMVNDQRLHIRFARSHEYVVGLPATGICRSCGTLNQHSPRTQTAALQR